MILRKNKLILLLTLAMLLPFLTACNDETDDVQYPDNNYHWNLSLEINKNLDHLGEKINFTQRSNLLIAQTNQLVDKSNLVLNFENQGYQILLDDVELTSDITNCDLSFPRRLTMINGTDTVSYTLLLIDSQSIPTVLLDTYDLPILDKETWIKSKIEIFSDSVSYRFPDNSVRVKGRGNTTWEHTKKPYNLKLSKKQEILGMPAHDRWVLLANAFDPTMLRNFTSFYLSENLSHLDYTPRMTFVNLYLNGKYQGVYEFGESIKMDEDRVNVSQDGYILEVDAKWADGEPVFFSPLGLPVNIKYPGSLVTANQFQFISNYFNEIETVLYDSLSQNRFKRVWEYLDKSSFVEWYLVNEITKNNDAIFFTSCYMNLAPDGKLKMGPVWDFDIAMGNTDYNGNEKYDGFWIKNSVWLNQMFHDPTFVALVKSRFNEIYEQKQELVDAVKNKAADLKNDFYINDAQWRFYELENEKWQGEYSQSELDKMLTFIEMRFDWLKENINQL